MIMRAVITTTSECNCKDTRIHKPGVLISFFSDVGQAVTQFKQHEVGASQGSLYWAVHFNGAHILNIVYKEADS